MSGRWYPNADGNKCPGSFMLYRGASHSVDVGFGKPRQWRGTCPYCQRVVGFRNPKTKQFAQHRGTTVPLPAAVPQVTTCNKETQ
jgi:hypothetical protein